MSLQNEIEKLKTLQSSYDSLVNTIDTQFGNIEQAINLIGDCLDMKEPLKEVEEKEVNFYDYKGNCIYSYTATEAMNLKELPPGPPDDEWVTFHSWSETLESVNRGLPLDVGAYYDVIDELKEGGWNVIMEIYAYGTIGVSKNVQLIDWGDGEISDSFPATHTYQKSGTYIVKAKIYNGGTLLISDSDYTYQNFSVTRIHCTNNTYLALRGSNAIIYGNLLYYTHPNTADYSVLYQTPSLTSLQCLVLKNRGKAGFPTSGSCRRTILPTGESLGMWNSDSNGDYMMYQRNLPYNLTVISAGYNRGVITKIPTTCKRMNINRVSNRATCFIYTPIPPVLVSASASKLYIPIGSLSDYQNATNYGQATFLECIPTEINSFSITADDVPANATTTTIHVRANLSMKAWYDDTMVPRDFQRDVISESFEANTSSKPREIEISFSMLGETRTCTIIQSGALIIDEAESLSQDAINYISTEYGSDVMTALESYIETSSNPNRIRGAINLDPDIVCSLVETSKTRWLVGDGKVYCKLRNVGRMSDTYEMKFKYNVGGSYRAWGVFGQSSYTPINMSLTYSHGISVRWAHNGGQQVDNLAPLTSTAWHTLKIENGYVTFDGVNKGRSEGHKDGFVINYPMYLFAINPANNTPTATMNGCFEYYKHTSQAGEVLEHCIPCQHNNQAGMLDLVSLQFYPNANTEGAFTIQITDKE